MNYLYMTIEVLCWGTFGFTYNNSTFANYQEAVFKLQRIKKFINSRLKLISLRSLDLGGVSIGHGYLYISL